MNKQQRIFLLIGGLLAAGVLALLPLRASANVTLTKFTATSVPGLAEVYVEWTTATQYNTVGFFVTRSDSAAGPYVRVSEPIERQGDDLTGWEYDPWIDMDVDLGQTYWYKLEEIETNQQSLFYGPVSVTAGAAPTTAPTSTFTPTPTRTPTVTPSPTATAQVDPVSSPVPVQSQVVVTPRLVVGATVTPRPDSAGGSAAQAVAITSVAKAPDTPAQPQTDAAAAPSESNVAAETSPAQPPAAAPVLNAAQPPDPTLSPPDAAPAGNEPVVVVTEAAPTASPAGATNSPALLLVGAAFLFLGMAFFILRQVRQ